MAPQKNLGNPNSQNNNDPFTDLPDGIIHRIFSFLDKNNVVSLRAVSKRFLQVCITSSYLSFIPKPCNQYSPSKEKCKQFREFLDRFWIDRSSKDDAASINRSGLHIEWTCNVCKFKDKASAVTAWIQEAVKFNFQELHLKMGLSDILSECISNCESLTVLNIEGGLVSLPRVVFHSLQVLSIKGPCYMKDCNDDDKKISIGEWISNSCPSLKKLSLEQFTNGNLIMTSSSLEELTVSLEKYGRVSGYNINISMEKLKTLSLGLPVPNYDASTNNNIVRIIAPNLHDFTFKAGFGRCDFLGEYTYLYKASIDVPADCNYLVALHQSITRATSLQINLLALETLFKNDRCKQLLIENLHHLILEAETTQNSMWGMGMSSNDEYIPSIISFLKLLLNIKSLTINRPWERHDSQFAMCSPWDKSITDMKHNEPESLMQFESLKEVVIELRTGTKEIGLIKYLLKYARRLEKVTIFYANIFFHILAGIDIQNFEIASTSLELIFLQKEFDKGEEDDYSQLYG